MGTPVKVAVEGVDLAALFHHMGAAQDEFPLDVGDIGVLQLVDHVAGHQGVLVFASLFKEPHPGARPLVPLLHAAVDIVLALPGEGDGAIVHGEPIDPGEGEAGAVVDEFIFIQFEGFLLLLDRHGVSSFARPGYWRTR